MKMAVIAIDFEHVMEYLLGYEGLAYLLHDEPALVAEVFNRWGQKVYDYYALVVDMPEVGCIFHADDLGFKTATLLSPAAPRRHVFPWFKKYAALAHAHGKMYWYHCCGNIYSSGVIDDLIDDVGVDALHSYQDVILPVAEFKSRFGGRVAAGRRRRRQAGYPAGKRAAQLHSHDPGTLPARWSLGPGVRQLGPQLRTSR